MGYGQSLGLSRTSIMQRPTLVVESGPSSQEPVRPKILTNVVRKSFSRGDWCETVSIHPVRADLRLAGVKVGSDF